MALHFSKQEFEKRKLATLKSMKEQNLDALLMFRQESMFWLTGYDTFGYVFFQTLILDQKGNIILLTRAPDLRQAQNTSNIEDIRIWVDKDQSNPTDDLKIILNELNLKNKKKSEDFVLWKPSKDDEPSWDSPWGKGRPGWHLECSAMSKKYLGDVFDIHGGGIDLIFPHHENEIAQSRCANDTKVFANYWIHNAFITMSNEKMAKSTGNIIKIKDFKDNVDGQVLKLVLISAHYKQPLDWNKKLLEDCKNTIDKWYEVYLPANDKIVLDEDILSPLYDDLNTPGYIANLHQLYDKALKGNNEEKSLFVLACNFIGILNKTKEKWIEFKKKKSSINEDDILEMIELRNKARADKNYKEADIIRDKLLDKGVLIEDKDGKTIWKIK